MFALDRRRATRNVNQYDYMTKLFVDLIDAAFKVFKDSRSNPDVITPLEADLHFGPRQFYVLKSLLHYTASICQYSNSTGVERPKMLIITVTRPLASSMASTSPSKFSNVPSLIFTRSLTLKLIFSFGASSVFSSCLATILATSCGSIGVGLPAEPVKSPMPGVSRTRNQVSSLISM